LRRDAWFRYWLASESLASLSSSLFLRSAQLHFLVIGGQSLSTRLYLLS
jgi:hypothetical protein